MTEDELPSEWTSVYGAFVTIGDLVLATCRTCHSVVFSDFFVDHIGWHEKAGELVKKVVTITREN